jgi:hypothetical protein
MPVFAQPGYEKILESRDDCLAVSAAKGRHPVGALSPVVILV